MRKEQLEKYEKLCHVVIKFTAENIGSGRIEKEKAFKLTKQIAQIYNETITWSKNEKKVS